VEVDRHMRRVIRHVGEDRVKAVRKVHSNAHLFASVRERSVHVELGSQRLNRLYIANALAAVAATDDGDRNYLRINLLELVALFMIRSGKYSHAYRDYCGNRGSSVIDLLFARLHHPRRPQPSWPHILLTFSCKFG
jgi:hypothetical protein